MRDVLLLVGVLFVAACATATTETPTPTTQAAATTIVEGPPPVEVQGGVPPVASVVAEQIRTNNTQCVGENQLDYEACLLYQGALYRWGGDLTPDTVVKAASDPEFQALYTIAVARATPILAATDVYAFQEKVAGDFALPGVDPDVILESRYGICGNHSALALGLLDKAGIQARSVRFFYTDPVSGLRNSHATVEAWIDGKWRYIDTTYGIYWGDLSDLASLEEVLALDDPAASAVWNAALVPDRDPTAINFAPFEPYRVTNPSILRGEVGTISLELDGVETLEHVPSYVGDNQPDGFFGGVEFALDVSGDTIVLEVRGGKR
jgi:hypothetical protein